MVGGAQMKSVLRKRFKRELTHEFGRYLVIFLFLAGIIGFVSGFLVGGTSMHEAYFSNLAKYQVEDGHLEFTDKASEELQRALNEEQLTVYEQFFYRGETDELDSHIRIFQPRTEGNLPCVLKGRLPEGRTEIALDRMYADYNKIKVGDPFLVEGKALTVSGLVALPDYPALYENASDMMFDAKRFGVALLSLEGFQSFSAGQLHYQYAFTYPERLAGKEEEKKRADELLPIVVAKAMENGNQLVDFLPAYQNNAIQLPGDDLGKDKVFVEAFLYIVIATLAFIFAITTSNTITKESMVIGTLRASGYTKMELIIHYMTLPMLVVLTAALSGNILGYTVFRNFAADMYGGSYNIGTYEIKFHADAFIRTTLIPCCLMFVINLAILVKKLSLSPLLFLRRDIGMQKKKGVMRLSDKLGIMTRFRLRVLFRNIPHYLTLFVGIFFANALILFGVALPSVIDRYETNITKRMICEYQYILKTPVSITNENAEPYAVTTLKTLSEKLNEEISIFGLSEESRYLPEASKGEVMISSAYAKKYKLSEGDTITLREQYDEKKYTFSVDNIVEYPGALCVFLPEDMFCRVFERETGFFNGYFSNEKLTELPSQAVALCLTAEDLTKAARQFRSSLGSVMDLLYVFGITMFLLMSYLLTRLIIEKDAQSISMAKILGYSNGEIGKLYILTTSIVVVLCLIGTIPLVDLVVKLAFELILRIYPGWLEYSMPFSEYMKIAALGIGSYLVVLVLQMRKIKKIKKSDALKTAE